MFIAVKQQKSNIKSPGIQDCLINLHKSQFRYRPASNLCLILSRFKAFVLPAFAANQHIISFETLALSLLK